MSFAALGLPEPILRSVRAVGYQTPTPIQSRAIPMILPGRDLVAAAQTGSGKTAAFLLPILTRLLDGPRRLRALVLVPTRELAAQVEESARNYSRHTNVRVGAVYGGVPIPPQERMLRHQGVELLVATPGRLLDLQGRQSVALEEVEVLVLDEADRMVDMGFAPDLRRILALLPERRQTLLFSATMPGELNRVASEALRSPQRLELAPPTRPAASITQAFYPVPRHLKTDLLDEMLRRIERDGVIVFTRTKHGADRLARQLERRGHDVVVLHGDRSQGQRERALRDFKKGRVDVLVATDIASRGIDVDDVSHVVNYDVPRAPEDYVHRIGRTGRMDATGDALTLVSPEERKEAEAIERFMGLRVARQQVPDFDYHRTAAPAADRETRERRPREGGRGAAPTTGRVTVRRWGADAPSAHSSGGTQSHGPSAPHASGEGAGGRRRRGSSDAPRSRRRM
ncbi:MAG TPA: DEAD/DEAH box helicase [Candidatus Acidoferrales bacterium]|nr:DEAD/DEAH box helicase [Candidatus Acidoferrales bacterium]